MTRLLVVNADDMGLTPGVCRAVRRAHADGIVTSTSVLAVGTAFDEAATAVREAGDLGLGAHLAIVGEDRPLLSAREVPTLWRTRKPHQSTISAGVRMPPRVESCCARSRRKSSVRSS